MSPETAIERRQSPRAALPQAVECELNLRTRVRLVDISFGGVMIAAEVNLPVGLSGHLQSTLGGNPLKATVQVNRVVDPADRGKVKCFGTTFTTMDERSRRSLEEFLRKASH